jgi:co-chaperonin GroES (HSP10)
MTPLARQESAMTFRPLHDRVAVRRLDQEEKTRGGIIIPDTAKEKPQEGEVIAVVAINGAPVRNSPGRRNKDRPTPVGKRVDLIHASGTAGPGPSRSRRPATLAISMPR